MSLTRRCEAFDQDLMADLTQEGGVKYALMGALAYRQCLAGTGIAADAHHQPMLFTKENTSNGDIATVDVIFPMIPQMIPVQPYPRQSLPRPDLDLRLVPALALPERPA